MRLFKQRSQRKVVRVARRWNLTKPSTPTYLDYIAAIVLCWAVFYFGRGIWLSD